MNTIRLRKLLKLQQACKYVVEAQREDGSKEWRQLGSFVDKQYAEGFVAGFRQGIGYLTTLGNLVATPIFQDEWQDEKGVST